MKISVIVPVYNVEKYIDECIESILMQSLREIEILIINDGSQDKSIDKVKKYKDKRIKIINQENGGLSKARNTGLDNCKGEYIVFVDSDDFILQDNALEEMYYQIKADGADILVGNALAIYENGSCAKIRECIQVNGKRKVSSEEFLIKYLKNRCMLAPVWLNMYSNKILKNNRFKESILHEDEEFTPRIFLKAKTISIYKKEFYGYRQRSGSISKGKDMSKNSMDLINTCKELEEEFNFIKNAKLKVLYKDYLVMLMIHAIRIGKNKDIDNELCLFLTNNSYSLKNKLKAFVIRHKILNVIKES